MKFLKSALITFITNIFIFMISIITTVITSRMLGTDGKGILSLGNNLTSFGLILFGLGIESASGFYIGKDKKNLNSALGINTVLALIGFVFLMILQLLNTQFHFKIMEGLNNYVILAVFLTVVVSIMKSGMLNNLMALQDYVNYNKINLLDRILTFLVLVLALIIFNTAEAALASYLISSIVIFIVLAYIMKKKYNASIKIKNNLYKEFLSFGFKSQLSNLVSQLNYRVDIFIVNQFMTKSAVGIYSNAATLGETMWQIPGTISTIVYPMTTNSKDKLSMKDFINKVTRMTLALVVICAIALIIISKPVILILLGKEFAQSYDALLWLIPGISFFSVSKVLANYIAGLGHVEKNVITSTVASIVNILLNIILIPRIGIIGASLATTVSYSVASIMQIYYYRKFTGSNLSELLLIKVDDINEIKVAVMAKLKKS